MSHNEDHKLKPSNESHALEKKDKLNRNTQSFLTNKRESFSTSGLNSRKSGKSGSKLIRNSKRK